MDCVVEACIPPRRSSPHQPRSSSFSSGVGGNTTDCSHTSSCAGAAILFSETAVVAEFLQHNANQQRRKQGDEEQRRQNNDNNTQFTKCLSLCTCGGSTSNLTTLSNTTTSTTNTSTNTSASTTGSSEQSTPLSGASSHQQQLLRAKAQRAVAEANHASHHNPSLDSRSNSRSPRHDKEERDEEEAYEVEEARRTEDLYSNSTHLDTTSPATAASVAHFTSRSTPSSKRTRVYQQQQSVADATRVMHIPNPTTFAESSSSARHNTLRTTSSTVSPVCAGAKGGVRNDHNTDATRVQVAADCENEMNRTALQSQQQQTDEEEREQEYRGDYLQHHFHERHHAERSDDEDANAYDSNSGSTSLLKTPTGITGFKVVPTMAAGSHSSVRAVAPDATPQEPPPKRFATGVEDSMEELGYAVMRQTEQQQSTRTLDDNEEDRGVEDQRPASDRRLWLHSAVTDSAEETIQQQPSNYSNNNSNFSARVEEVENEMQSPDNSTMQSGEQRGSTTSRRASRGQPSKDKEGHRKSRLMHNNASTGSLLSGLGGRHSNDSITASIPYDPSRFNTPPLAQQQQQHKLEESPFTQDSNNIGSKSDTVRQGSESQPSCATPPDAPVLVKTQQQQQEQQQQHAEETFQPPPTQPSIKLTETRYAFMAISFMMRMLCKLHKGEPIPSSDFHSHCIPPMSVTMYVQRLVRYCACSGEALLCAFLLLLKYVFHSGHPITIYNAHRLLITSVVLGIKLRDDVYYSNVYYGRIGGISGREMNKLEVLFLSKLDWETQVHEEEYATLLDLLEKLAVDADPTSEQLAAFAAAFPEKVLMYVPDEDDDEIEEAAAKFQQGLAGSSSSTTASGATTAGSATKATSSPSSVSTEVHNNANSQDVQQLKTLRGAYRLHQWHTLVEPWMAQLQRDVFAKKNANAQAAAEAWQAEGKRWEQYYREDEEAAATLQRENSASAWLSPLSVQKRATSAATINPSNCNNDTSNDGNAVDSSGVSNITGSAWPAEPPYQSSWPHADTIPYNTCGGVASNGSYVSQQLQQQQQLESNPRYSNFINSANVVPGGYFGSSFNNAGPSVYRYGIGASHRVASAPMASAAARTGVSANNVRYHTATNRAQQQLQSRPSSATFGITNRAATMSSFGAGYSNSTNNNSNNGPGSSSTSQYNNATASALMPPHQHQQPSLVGTTARAASPTSSTTPGSGINVNAQPYYYVSSRIRKQQQQQQQQQSASTASAGQQLTPSSTDASLSRPNNNSTLSATDANDPCSSSSSFTSPIYVNPPSSFNNCSSNPSVGTSAGPAQTSNTTSSGVEAVLAAMKRGSSSALYSADSDRVVSHGNPGESNNKNNSTTTTALAMTNHTFPAQPIAKMMLGGHEGEQATSAHVPRRSPQTAHQPPAHRRSTYALQHSLGKKRSKPDSYKDY